MRASFWSRFATHGILIAWCLVVLFPLWTMVINSVKPRLDIFSQPFMPPTLETITFSGYTEAWNAGRFDIYFRNSLFVTVVSLLLILFLGSLAAYALASWKSNWSNFFYIVFLAGLMIPIRLGTINLITIVKNMGLIDSVFGLIPIYVAMGLPIAAFVLTDFIRSLPGELREAAYVDGASEWRIYSSIVLPLIRPAMATVAIFNLIPIWNDLWFPLILIRQESQRTVMLGTTLLFGQYQTNWTNILAVLTMSALPLLVLYLLMSKQFIKGLTAGAVKG
jgi:raffinose/stachyose/melibiose transport system permease protein